jgi:hypothetical protein
MFCGGKNCKYEDFTLWKDSKNVHPAIDGLSSNWVSDNILALQRPSERLIEEFKVIEQFKRANVKAIVNLQCLGEHAFCGDGILDGAFSYRPETFMNAGMYYYNFGWTDMSTPTMHRMLDIVQVLDFHSLEGHCIAVHCHAGLGRTGLVAACYLVHSDNLSAEDAVMLVRMKRPGSIQTKKQHKFVTLFQKALQSLRAVYPSQSIAMSQENYLVDDDGSEIRSLGGASCHSESEMGGTTHASPFRSVRQGGRHRRSSSRSSFSNIGLLEVSSETRLPAGTALLPPPSSPTSSLGESETSSTSQVVSEVAPTNGNDNGNGSQGGSSSSMMVASASPSATTTTPNSRKKIPRSIVRMATIKHRLKGIAKIKPCTLAQSMEKQRLILHGEEKRQRWYIPKVVDVMLLGMGERSELYTWEGVIREWLAGSSSQAREHLLSEYKAALNNSNYNICSQKSCSGGETLLGQIMGRLITDYLECLAEPVLSIQVAERLIAEVESESSVKKACLSELPVVSLCLIRRLLDFLTRIPEDEGAAENENWRQLASLRLSLALMCTSSSVRVDISSSRFLLSLLAGDEYALSLACRYVSYNLDESDPLGAITLLQIVQTLQAHYTHELTLLTADLLHKPFEPHQLLHAEPAVVEEVENDQALNGLGQEDADNLPVELDEATRAL